MKKWATSRLRPVPVVLWIWLAASSPFLLAPPLGLGSTTDFTDRAAFVAATNNLTTIGFGGILPPGVRFGDYSQLDLAGVSLSTPISGTFVNITTADFYAPSVYPQDFIVDSVNQNTGLPNSNNELVITLTKPTLALGLDLGGLGFSGVGSGTITLSNGHVFSIPSLLAVGHTQFIGFVSTDQITSVTFSTVNDSWVVEDMLTASPVISSCSVALSPTGQSFDPQGGLGSFDINTGTGCVWDLALSDAWITIIGVPVFPGGGPPRGPGKVTYAVAANGGAPRNGTISVAGNNFLVNQQGVGSCTRTISPTHAALDDTGGNIRPVVIAPSGCTWTTTSNAGWITVTSGASGISNGSVVLTVAANTGAARSGTATIAGQTFSVTQGAGACGALDVTGETRVQGAGLSYVPFTTYFYTGTITVTNSSGTTLPPPLFIVLVGLPNHLGYPAGNGVIGAAQTSCFTPAGDAMYLLPTGDLPPGRSTQVTPLFFTQSLFGGVPYTPRVLSGTPTK